MVVGIDDALKVMTLSGNRIGPDEKQTIKSALLKYIKAASAEYAKNSYGAAYDPDVSRSSACFL